MNEPRWLRLYRFGFGLLTLAAVAWSYVRDSDSLGNFLSKFTYESNTFAALVLIGTAMLTPATLGSVGWDRLRGAAVMYMLTTFLVYGFLINGFDNPLTTTRPWTHTVLHQITPVVVALDLMIRPFANRLTWRSNVLWMIYPIAFLIYSLIRGELTGWYPYDFIDPAKAGGWGAVTINVLGITVGFLVLSSLLMLLSRLYHRQQGAAAPVEAPSTVAP